MWEKFHFQTYLLFEEANKFLFTHNIAKKDLKRHKTITPTRHAWKQNEIQGDQEMVYGYHKFLDSDQCVAVTDKKRPTQRINKVNGNDAKESDAFIDGFYIHILLENNVCTILKLNFCISAPDKTGHSM